MTDPDAPAPSPWSFLRLNSFRAKFLIVVGGAVLFDLLVGGGVALWNVNRLSRDATKQIESGLTKASQEYLQNYIETTALRADLLFDRMHSEVAALAGSMQTRARPRRP